MAFKFSQILILICLHHVVQCREYVSFQDDFFRHKNLRNIWTGSCSLEHNLMVSSWRKNSKEPISVRLIGKFSSFVSHANYYPDETIGIYMDSACNVSLVLSWLKKTGASRRKSIVLWWGSPRIDDQTIYSELVNVVDIFHGHPSPENKVEVLNSRMELVLMWEPEKGMIDLGLTDRHSLSGKVIKGMVSLYDKRHFENSDLRTVLTERSSSSLTDNLMRFSFVLHQFLEQLYHFRWQLYLCDADANGEVYSMVNGSLNYNFVKGGQFEALSTGRVDVGLYPAERLSVGMDFMDSLLPIATLRQGFVFSSPVLYLEPHILYSQFSGVVWGISIVLTLMVAVVSSISTRMVVLDDEDANELTFVTNILNVVGAITQQGLERTTDKVSVRIAHFFLLFLTMMLFIFYNTGLLMYTLEPPQKDIEYFGELLKEGFHVAAEDTPYNRFQLQGNYSHPDEFFYQNCQNGWGTCRTEIQFYNITAGARKIQKERTAFFGYVPNLYAALEEIMTDRELVDLKEVTVHKPFLVSTFVRKQFPYKELFSRGLLLLKEAGITHHEEYTWITKKPKPLIDSYFVIASLYSTSVAFFLLFAGTFASLLLFALEWLYHRKILSVKFGNTTGDRKSIVAPIV